jgi:hypothetical protein
MPVANIPPSKQWTCDLCDCIVTGPLMPAGWARVVLRTTERQVDKLLCDTHVPAVAALLEPA